MKINTNDIHIPRNYVLVQPDAEFDEFQQKGKTTFQVGKKDLEHVASHYSIRGKVYAVPEALEFNQAAMRSQMITQPFGLSPQEIAFYFRSNLAEMNHQKNTSMLFDTNIEVKMHDIVFFSYIEHYNAYDEGRWVQTELGDMMLMRYDNLICCHADHPNAKPTMLNGFMLVEPITIESTFGTNIYKKAGIYISNRKQDIELIKRDFCLGYVRFSGEPCRGYLDMPEHKDGERWFTEGEVVLFNPRVAPALEYGLHKAHFGGKQLIRLKRRDIFCIFPSDFEKSIKTNMFDFSRN